MQSTELADWVSAAATMLAAIVALAVPFIMKHLDGKQAQQAKLESLTEIWGAIEHTVRIYVDVRQAATMANAEPKTRFRQIAVEFDAMKDTLDRLLAQSIWDSDTLVAGSATLALAQGIGDAARQLVDEQYFAAGDVVKSLHQIAQLANSRNEIVRKKHGIERAAGQALPIV